MPTTALHYVQNQTATDQSDINQFVDVLTGVSGSTGITVTSLSVVGTTSFLGNSIPFTALGGTTLIVGAGTANTGSNPDQITLSSGLLGSNSVTISATSVGGDANIAITMIPLGTSPFQINTPAGFHELQVTGPATGATNFVTITSFNTGGAPAITAGGVDANVTLQLHGQGTGSVALTNVNGNFVLQASGSTSTLANYIAVSGAVTASHPQVQAVGSDANINLQLATTGTGNVDIRYATTALGGGAAPTFGTIGGSGPATAAQNSWLKVLINGTASFLPVWR
jgi:hypothetical protein